MLAAARRRIDNARLRQPGALPVRLGCYRSRRQGGHRSGRAYSCHDCGASAPDALAAVRHAARGAQVWIPRRQTKKLRGGSKVGVAPPCSVEPFHFQLRAAWRSNGVIVRRVASSRAMDFKGQYYCERLFQILVVIFGAIGFVVGYLQQDFRITFYFLATEAASQLWCAPLPLPRARALSRCAHFLKLACRTAPCFVSRWLALALSLYMHIHLAHSFLIAVPVICPDWPWWNRHPLEEWLEVVEEEEPPPKEKKKKKSKDKEKAEAARRRRRRSSECI